MSIDTEEGRKNYIRLNNELRTSTDNENFNATNPITD
jgi:hypothetical protein